MISRTDRSDPAILRHFSAGNLFSRGEDYKVQEDNAI